MTRFITEERIEATKHRIFYNFDDSRVSFGNNFTQKLLINLRIYYQRKRKLTGRVLRQATSYCKKSVR